MTSHPTIYDKFRIETDPHIRTMMFERIIYTNNKPITTTANNTSNYCINYTNYNIRPTHIYGSTGTIHNISNHISK